MKDEGKASTALLSSSSFRLHPSVKVSLIGLFRRRREKAAAEPAAEERATFEPLARSAFRALGVAARASQREVADAASSVRLALKLGVRKSFDSDLAWLGHVAREESDVRDAVGRLSEPAQRAFERLYWFDEPPAVAARVSNVEELERAVREIESTYTSEGASDSHAVSRDECATLHDAALLALAGLTRLDPLTLERGAWGRAFELWRRVFESEEFWARLVASDLRGDFEQLVTYAEVRELRASAPRVVTRRLAERARDAALRTDAGECGRLLSLLRGAGLPRPLVEEYESECLGPLEDTLTEKIDAAFAWLSLVSSGGRGAATVRNYSNAAWRRFRVVMPQLTEFASAAGASHYAARRVLEHAASKLLKLSECFDSAGRHEESLFVALKAHALAPPGGEALAEAEARLRALDADEVIRVEAEDEYADALARELSDTREPEKLFKDDPVGDKTLDSIFNSPASWNEPRRNTFWPALLVCLGFAFTCFALQFFGVVKTGPARRYPSGFPMPAYTPFQMNLNYNYNLNLNIRPYPIPTPLILEEPGARKPTRGHKHRANRSDSRTRMRNGNALLLPPPAP
jgi:hypothetical protein